MNTVRNVFSRAVAGLCFWAAGAAAAMPYSVTTLPFGSDGVALNNAGFVAGSLGHLDGSRSLGLWSNGSFLDLGLPSSLPPEFNIVQATAMNDSGVIVGTVRTAAGGVGSRAFVYSGGTFNVLGLVDSSDIGGIATGVNASGQVVGYDNSASNNIRAWSWSAGSYSAVAVSGIATVAQDVNSSGVIVGNRVTDCCSMTGFFAGSVSASDVDGTIQAVNDAGVAVGSSNPSGSARARLFANGTSTSILTVPSTAKDINNLNQTVGWYQPQGVSGPRLFLWDEINGAVDLMPDGYEFTLGTGINDLGQIVGYGRTSAGLYQSFLLSPDQNGELIGRDLIPSPPPAPMSEPGSLALAAVALIGVTATRRRRSAAPTA